VEISRGIDAAESRLRHRTLVGAVTGGRAGLGSSTTPHYEKVKRKDRLVQDEVQASLEEQRAGKMI